jgi:hypothetical protein
VNRLLCCPVRLTREVIEYDLAGAEPGAAPERESQPHPNLSLAERSAPPVPVI